MICPLIAGTDDEQDRQTCLNCPYPCCLYELPQEHAAKMVRDIKIRHADTPGKSEGQLAATFAVSPRTVQRAPAANLQHVDDKFYDHKNSATTCRGHK